MFEDHESTLLVTATHSPDLTPPYVENWLAEPLLILFGQLVYPRLVARSVGDGRVLISLRRVPPLMHDARCMALWDWTRRFDPEEFWIQYRQLLTLIAKARDDNGQPNFEAHRITTLYQEIIQAHRGTRSALALALTTSVEALVKLLHGKDRIRMDAALLELQSAVISERHRLAWKEIRHKAAHGERLSPYPNKEEDEALIAVTEMIH